MQKEQELMKNHNIKEMIKNQKMMAEERKDMVSYLFLCIYILTFFQIGTTRKTPLIEKQIDKFNFGGK